jgi:hypothetical protein
MSLSREAMLDLMALADGELEGDARERVERLAAGSDEARRLLEAMRAPVLGAVVAHASAERAGGAEGIAEAVMARIAAEASGAGGAARSHVVPIGAAREARGRSGQARPRAQVVMAGMFAALAIAAAAALWARSNGSVDVGAAASVVAPVEIEPPVVPATSQSAKALLPEGVFPPSGVEVDEIDSPSHDVHVFEISAGASSAAAAAPGHASSVVIMIEDQAGSGK